MRRPEGGRGSDLAAPPGGSQRAGEPGVPGPVVHFLGIHLQQKGRYKVKRSWGVLALSLPIITAMALATGASASTVNNHQQTGNPSFGVLLTPGQSFTAVVRNAAASPRKQPVAATIEAMLERVAQGRRVYVPEGTRYSIVNVPATRFVLRAALRAAMSAARLRRTPQVLKAPKDWPINGVGCHPTPDHYTAWCGKYIIEGGVCDPSGCPVTDKVTAKTTDNPGVKTSLVSYNSLYSPDNFNFTQIHFEWFTLCYAGLNTCGSGNTNSFPGTSHGTFKPTSNAYLYDSHMAHAFELWGFFEPLQEWVGDPGRTGTALCGPKSNPGCYY